ncbi:MAG TPA: cupin domain-containing protein [Terriglobales bacterium]|nr:cupin domain-containing protein [Terriglobales bacterium]
MKRYACRFVLLVAAVGLVALCAWAQGADETHIANSGQLKFGPGPNLPSCLTMAVEHGDPSKGAFTLLLKFTSGCRVPMHWHTSAEELILVSGSGKMQMQDGTSSTVDRGGFAYIPSKHPHAFTCATACTAFLSGDAAFDIHYVDKSGNEIPAEQALSVSKPKPAAKKNVM